MKKIIFISIFLIKNIILNAQSTCSYINYSYDNAGNRTARTVTFTCNELLNNSGANRLVLKPEQENDENTDQLKVVNRNFTLYPNPATNEVNIISNTPSVFIEKLSIVNMSGKIIFNEENMGKSATINISDLSSGTYFVKIKHSSKEEKLFKFIKQ